MFRLERLIPFRRFERPAVERWSSRGSFLAVALGAVAGMGLLWRFPALALTYGGGTFLIAYAVALILLGIPLLKLEQAVGHRAQRAAPRAFRGVHRRWEWLGWWATILAATLAILGVVIATFALLFAGDSLLTLVNGDTELLWAHNPSAHFNARAFDDPGASAPWSLPSGKVFYWLAFLWAFLAFVAARGTRTVASAAQWLLGTSLVLGLIFAVRFFRIGLFPDDGLVHGLAWALTPQPAAFGELALWLEAAGHACFTLLVGTGANVAITSTLPRNADVTNNASLLGVLSAGLTFVGYLACASLLGFLALSDGRLVPDIATAFGTSPESGIDVVLQVFPHAFVHLANNEGAEPGGVGATAVWAFALFASLAGFGLVTVLVLLHAVASALREKFALARLDTGLLLAAVGFVLTAGLCGIRAWDWIDTALRWVIAYGLFPVALLECLCAGWVADTRELIDHCNRHSERRLGFGFSLGIKLFIPVVLFVLITDAVTSPRLWPGLSPLATVVVNVVLATAAILLASALARRRGRRRPSSDDLSTAQLVRTARWSDVRTDTDAVRLAAHESTAVRDARSDLDLDDGRVSVSDDNAPSPSAAGTDRWTYGVDASALTHARAVDGPSEGEPSQSPADDQHHEGQPAAASRGARPSSDPGMPTVTPVPPPAVALQQASRRAHGTDKMRAVDDSTS